jgi:hypothetical protein
MGINKFRNLILTVRKDHLPDSPDFVHSGPKVHFDLAGYEILSWKADELDTFRRELEKLIKRRLSNPEAKVEKQPQVWDDEWLAKNHEAALSGLAKLKLTGNWEMRVALYPPKPLCSQRQLVDSARSSMANISGWPVGVYIPNGEFRPRPRADGIVAEIATEDTASYDYWAIKTNGDFYSLSSLWEDGIHPVPPKLFYEPTILKATDGLLYCARLYSRLGVAPTSRIKFLHHYAGLKGRILASEDIVGSHLLRERRSSEDEMTSEIDTSLKDIKTNIINLVKELLSPLFVLFDFYILPDSEYTNLVKKFAKGEIP